jgi:hypothetical protein
MRRGVTLALLAAAAVGCGARSAPPPAVVASSDAAHRRGIAAYEIRHADAHEVDVALRGATPGQLHSLSRAGVTVQELETPGGSVTVTSSLERVEARISTARGVERWTLGEKRGADWIVPAARPPSSTLGLVATVFAVDVDMAVQGSCVVEGGRAHVACTLECTRAATCADQDPSPRCAQAMAGCGACMDQGR